MCTYSPTRFFTQSQVREHVLTVLKATSGIIRNLLFLSPTRHLLYISDIEHGQLTRKFEHLACFFPGLLALAASTLDLPESEHQLYMWAAEGLGHSCWLMYADQASGLGPELVRMDAWPGDWKEGLWIEHVEAWQRAGSPGGKPPGVRDLSPPVTAREPKDYRIDVSAYLSRPEVRFLWSLSCSWVLIIAALRIDAGKHVCDVAHYKRCQVARAWMDHVGRYRKEHSHIQWIRQRSRCRPA